MARREDKPLYNSKAWRQRRASLLLAEPLCRMCAAIGRTTQATVADHVTPHRGNLELFYHGAIQPLCSTCHSAVKQAQENNGHLRGHDTQGYPLDPNHNWAVPTVQR